MISPFRLRLIATAAYHPRVKRYLMFSKCKINPKSDEDTNNQGKHQPKPHAGTRSQRSNAVNSEKENGFPNEFKYSHKDL